MLFLTIITGTLTVFVIYMNSISLICDLRAWLGIKHQESSLSLQSHRKLPILSTQPPFFSCRKKSFMPNLTAMLTAGILSLNTSTNSIQSACLLSSTKWPVKCEQTLSRRGKKKKKKAEKNSHKNSEDLMASFRGTSVSWSLFSFRIP